MAGFSDEDIRRVREANDLVSVVGERVPLRQRGKDFWCCCPIHDEKTPSCKIDPASQLWHCFGCGAGGDLFSFVMQVDDLTFPDAVRKLADRANLEISEQGKATMPRGRKAQLKAICKEAADFYHTQLMRGKSAEAAAARNYLAQRGFGGDVPKRWNLGFAPGRGALVQHLRACGYDPRDLLAVNVALDSKNSAGSTAAGATASASGALSQRGLRDRFFNRIIFPICDVQGEVIAFGGRIIGSGQPKYLNSQETPLFHKSEVLYGLDKAKAAMASSGVAVVVEGYTDVIALHEAGITNAVATLGTALTTQHIRILSRHAKSRIVYLFDGDEAGQRAADRALAFIDRTITPEAGRSRIELSALTLPDNLDPADFVADRGADALRSLLETAKPLLKYGIDRRLAAHDLSSAEGRAAALDDALSVLAPIKDSLLAKDYAVQIAGAVRAREDDVLERLSQLKAPPSAERTWRRRDDHATSGAGRMGDASRAAQPGTGNLLGGSGASAASNTGTALNGGTSLASGDGSANMSAGRGGAASRQSSLPQSELSRRRYERELLCLVVAHPQEGLRLASTLSQTQWHEALHARLANSILETLEAHPTSEAAELLTAACSVTPRAASILSSGTMAQNAAISEVSRIGDFLAEELSIGDAEDAIGQIRSQLETSDLDASEREMLFQSVVEMQKDLARRRAAHKP